ncbi:MAG: VOC family protein [Actinomycetota bacterium]|nr:VOC family protein [Actinomycetota bacterium]
MAPPMSGVLETVLYFSFEDETRRFYEEVMGMHLIGQARGRHLFFRAGSSVFLLFNAEATKKGTSLPAHGSTGQGHVCFLVPPSSYEGWKEHLAKNGIDVLQEVDWPSNTPEVPPSGSSFYFRDPSGNLLEIANADFWPR